MPVCHELNKPKLDLHRAVKFKDIFSAMLMYQDFIWHAYNYF